MSQPSRRTSLVLLAVGILVAVGLVWWWVGREPDDDGPPEPVEATTAELQALVDDSRRAVGLLENGVLDEAVALLDEIGEAVPSDPFAPRNLVVARLLELESVPDDSAEIAREARRALESLEGMDDGPLPHRLAARVEGLDGNSAAAVESIERAIALDPDDASLQFRLWLLTSGTEDEDLRQRGRTALEAAHRIEPANVFVLLELLQMRVETRDPQLPDAARAMSQLVEPFADGIRKRTTADVPELLEAAADAAVQGDWPTARRNVRIVANVVRPEGIAQSDRLRVDRVPLEFVSLDFLPTFYEQPNWREPAEPEPIAVRFVPEPITTPEALAPVVDLIARDFDLDGEDDLVVLTNTGVVVFLRRGEQFEETARFDVEGFTSLLAADLDADVPTQTLDAVPPKPPKGGDEDATTGAPDECQVADLDLVLWGPAGIVVVENRLADDGRRGLVRAKNSGPLDGLGAVTAATIADVDHDGDLDLIVAADGRVAIHPNRGNLTFDPALEPMVNIANGTVTSLLSVDVDEDVDVDLVVTATEGAGGWLENLRHGQLRWRPDASIPDGPAVDVLDVRGDGRWSLLARDDESVVVQPLVKIAGERLLGTTATEVAALDEMVKLWDFDNDGNLDLLGWGRNGLRVRRGTLDGRFRVVDEPPTEDDVTAADFADLDGDGDLDVVAAVKGEIVTFENEGGNANRWLQIGLRGQHIRGGEESASGRVNQYGLGSLLQARYPDGQRSRIVRRPWTHFGLGDRDGASVVRVLWTNGIPFNLIAPKADQLLCERQTLKGSCPYLYTWNGERFVFVTDLLWGAPIGLQFADGVLAPARSWENLLVPGELLVERDGYYELRITEELWEVGYFDHVALVAVDHPANVDVFTNEKVGPPAVAEHRLHTVARPRPPKSVRDSSGRDLLPLVRSRDETYARAFTRRIRQGLVDDHFLEIDLGPDAAAADRITLFLTGWLQPTDTSLNVALSHDPELDSSQPPSLQVVDESGEWKTVVPYTGFPGGKTKTIALDVSDVFLSEDRRLRLVTNMEFYWDHVFFTLDDAPAELRERPLELADAEVRCRGFSLEILPPGLGPHRYDYEAVSTEPRWPAIPGGFTRYGDVRDLLTEPDDRLVIIGAGDEMVLRFRVPEAPLPAGWTRDFVLHEVGWDKDADLNTVLGQSVEPLPFRGMSRYPYSGVEEYPQDPMLAEDRRRRHVRRQRQGALRLEPKSPTSAATPALD